MMISTNKPQVRLIIVVSVDQMRYDYLKRFATFFKGGLKTLSDPTKCRVFKKAVYQHSSTGTGAGHTVIGTGTYPRHSGIVANEWFDRSLQKRTKVVEDELTVPVGGGEGGSPHRLLTRTLGDAYLPQAPEARIISIAGKDRAAMLMCGRKGEAFWFDTESGNFVTSSFYRSVLPKWLANLNATMPAEKIRAGQWWRRFIANPKAYQSEARRDDFNKEYAPTSFSAGPNKDAHDLQLIDGKVFRNKYDGVARSPFLDGLTIEAAKAAVSELGLGSNMPDKHDTDILYLGLSATDLVGHLFGPRSQECMDVVLRVDHELGRFLDWLHSASGHNLSEDDTMIVLTADHGAREIPEYLSIEEGLDAHRIRIGPLETDVLADLRAIGNGFDRLLKEVDPKNKTYYEAGGFYIDLDSVSQLGMTRRNAEKIVKKVIKRQNGVAEVYTRSELLGYRVPRDRFTSLIKTAYFDGRSPDLLIRFKENYYAGRFPTGTGHGTPYYYDRNVPLCVKGPTGLIWPADITSEVGIEQVAPTLANILQFNLPGAGAPLVLK